MDVAWRCLPHGRLRWHVRPQRSNPQFRVRHRQSFSQRKMLIGGHSVPFTAPLRGRVHGGRWPLRPLVCVNGVPLAACACVRLHGLTASPWACAHCERLPQTPLRRCSCRACSRTSALMVGCATSLGRPSAGLWGPKAAGAVAARQCDGVPLRALASMWDVARTPTDVCGGGKHRQRHKQHTSGHLCDLRLARETPMPQARHINVMPAEVPL